MVKSSKNIKSTNKNDKSDHIKAQAINAKMIHGDYLISMSHAPSLNTPSHWFQMLPAVFFTAVIIMITRMTSYERPMGQFLWSDKNTQLTDFFSYYKMQAILICAIVALILILYRIFTQSFYIKRSYAYIPMIVYAIFVLLSYFFSDYKLFALWGWNDRFEGTVTLLCYMVMLFFIINTVNTETNVKWLVYGLAAFSSLLSLLGLSQALGHDFFRTTFGKKLITPSSFWDKIDTLSFTFQHNEIYQTVYNINYVSFYLTLLIPLFGLLFIRSVMLGKKEPIQKKIIWGAIFALLIYNLIGSASSGGILGMAFVVLTAIIVLNKRILAWKKPVVLLLIIAIVIAGTTSARWLPELHRSINGAVGSTTLQTTASAEKHKIDYLITDGHDVKLGYGGDEVIFETFPDDPSSLKITDSKGATLHAEPTGKDDGFQIKDSRFSWISLRPAMDDKGIHYLVLKTDNQDWPFMIQKDGVKYRNIIGNLVTLNKVPAIGWKDNQGFGSGRGYIWSRTLPMLKDTLILGHGADTYCIYFPQNDYVGKYNADWVLYMVVDKPHDLYMDVLVGTGGISMLALLVLWGIYLVQSVMIFWRSKYDSFLAYVGVGIFLGIVGFLMSAVVDDSSVSVMPMFYGLLGTGIAINIMLKKRVEE